MSETNTFKTAFTAAADKGDVGKLQELLKEYSDHDELSAVMSEGLMSAAYYGHFDAVKFLVAAGAGINDTDNSRTSPLMGAVSSGNLEIVRYLVERGADVNIGIGSDKRGYSVLIEAALSESLEVTRYLLEQGADYRVKELFQVSESQTAEEVARFYNLNDIADLLQEWRLNHPLE